VGVAGNELVLHGGLLRPYNPTQSLFVIRCFSLSGTLCALRF
jgi:hypothetical protein